MRLSCLVVALMLAFPAWAGDGRFEINQDKALAGAINGSLALDPPGFPVIITDPGSYVLTGDLLVTDPDLFVLDIRAADVSVDLNGFTIRGPQLCPRGGCVSTGGGHAIASFNVSPIPENTTVRNGSVSGFAGCIVLAAAHMHVHGLAVTHCTLTGIQVGEDGLVVLNRVSRVRFSGISMGTNTAFRDNVVTEVDLSGSGTSFAFEGGSAVGGNLCDDGSCSSIQECIAQRRRYYLSPMQVDGDAALAACAAGFHMASLAEIRETSALTYDTTLGHAETDAGSGPPRVDGWIRTGHSGTFAGPPGEANCLNWTRAQPLDRGSVASPYGSNWSDPGESASPWLAAVSDCDTPQHVWCVED